MKSSLTVRTLEPDASHVRLPRGLLTALALRPGDELYAVMVQGPRSSALGPLATLYATSLPHRAWGHLLRMSFTSGPGPGTLARLSECLQTLRLYPRFIESAETRPLNPSAGRANPLEGIGPDTTTIVEIPQCPGGTGCEGTTLHLLNTLLQRMDDRALMQQCSSRLQADLDALVGDPRDAPRLESIAPLHTLTHLASQLSAAGDSFRKVPLEAVPGESDRTRITCEPWRAMLWPDSRNAMHEVGRPGGVPLAAIVSVDTSEHLVTLQFYRLNDAIVASFDVAVPAAGLEQRWWRWVFDEIKEANGSVLGSRSSGRWQAKWGSLSVVAVLPGRRRKIGRDGCPPPDDISHAIDCIRGLKGHSEFTARSNCFEKLLKEVEGEDGHGGPLRRSVTEDCLGPDKAASQLGKPARTDSLLHNVRLWYDRETPVEPEYESRFGLNPFSFTKPLYLTSYRTLYGEGRGTLRSVAEVQETASRLRLAQRLRDHLTRAPTENVVLVGAYRSGKTSVINLVIDLINRSRGGDLRDDVLPTRPSVAVRVNAAVTPPELLFVAVFNEICKLTTSMYAGHLSRALAKFVRQVATKLSANVKELLTKEPSLELGFAAPFIKSLKLTLHGKDAADTKDAVELFAQRESRRMSAESTSVRAGRLRASITMLRILLREAARDFDDEKELDELKKSLTPEERSALAHIRGPLHVVVALDEVTDSAAWGSDWAFPAWRQLIEDPAGEASWLFSSTRPLASATDYSPLGNAMREYNLEPLQPAETDRLISNFESSEFSMTAHGAWSMRPTVTYYARRLIGKLAGHQPYVLQVLCCHLFEQSIRHEVPIITARVVERIVLERVLPDLADYFASQWRTLEADHADVIKDAIRESAENFTLEPWISERSRLAAPHRFRPEVQKAIERAGVGSSRHSTVLVPLFAKWVQQHFALSSKPPARK